MTPSKSAAGIYKQLPQALHPCPVCEGSSFTVLANKDRYGMGLVTVQCLNCTLIMSNPALTPEGQDIFYRSYYRQFYRGVDRPDSKYVRESGLLKRAMYTADFLTQHARMESWHAVLDLGCGDGSLLRTLGERFPAAQRFGIEPNQGFAVFAREHAGCPTYSSLEELVRTRPSSKFNLIVANHVLEHMYDPVAVCRQIRELLAPEGLIYVDVPDAAAYESLDALHIAHAYHFTGTTLKNVACRAALEVRLVEPHRPPHHPASLRALMCATRTPVSIQPTTDNGAAGGVRRIGQRAWVYTIKQRARQSRIATIAREVVKTLKRHLG